MIEALAAPPFDPAPRDTRLGEALANYPSWVFNEQLYRSIELMERYTIDLAIDLLIKLGVLDQLKDWRSSAEICELLCFKPQFHFALSWLLKRLVETGSIEARLEEETSPTPNARATRVYRLHAYPWQPDLERLRAIGLEIDPASAPTLDLLDKAASLYLPVARGEQSGEQALFDTQGIPLWLNYFSNENPTYAVNNWIAAIAARERIRAREKVRVLEIGAGANSGSEILLRCLNEHDLLPKLERYVITEPNAFFLRRGQRELSRRYPDLPLEWPALDMNRPWLNQGVRAGEFDLVYGVNVLHVAQDLLFTMDQAHESLAEDGWLIIGECVRPLPHQPIYVELIFQLLDSFTDVMIDPEFRPNPGFLTVDQWQRLYACARFARIEVTPDIDYIQEIYSHFFTAAICGQRSLESLLDRRNHRC